MLSLLHTGGFSNCRHKNEHFQPSRIEMDFYAYTLCIHVVLDEWAKMKLNECSSFAKIREAISCTIQNTHTRSNSKHFKICEAHHRRHWKTIRCLLFSSFSVSIFLRWLLLILSFHFYLSTVATFLKWYHRISIFKDVPVAVYPIPILVWKKKM